MRRAFAADPKITDWQSFTMTIGATTTPPTKGVVTVDTAMWRRVGDSVEITYSYKQSSGGSAGSGTYLFPLPQAMTIDTSKMMTPAGDLMGPAVGFASVYNVGGAEPPLQGPVVAYNTTNLALSVGNSTVVITQLGSALGATAGAVQYYFFAKVPIVGWSSR